MASNAHKHVCLLGRLYTNNMREWGESCRCVSGPYFLQHNNIPCIQPYANGVPALNIRFKSPSEFLQVFFYLLLYWQSNEFHERLANDLNVIFLMAVEALAKINNDKNHKICLASASGLFWHPFILDTGQTRCSCLIRIRKSQSLIHLRRNPKYTWENAWKIYLIFCHNNKSHAQNYTAVNIRKII